MNDKKDYKALLKLLEKSASAQTILNQLSELYHETDDAQLKLHVKKVAEIFRSTAMKSKLTVRLVDPNPAIFPIHPDLPKAIQDAITYCTRCKNSSEPQWQILARQAGWTPPTA